MSYFHVKVSFSRQQDNGLVKKETEQYLVDAMSFTETEARVIREVGESVRELYFDSIAHSPIQEVVSYGDTDLWFKCKVVYKDVDQDSGKEKKTTLYILVNAKDVDEAYSRCKDHLKSMLVPFEIPKVEETAICEIYQYEKPVPAGYKAVGNGPMLTEMRGKISEEFNKSELEAYLEELRPFEYGMILERMNELYDDGHGWGKVESFLYINNFTVEEAEKIADLYTKQ